MAPFFSLILPIYNVAPYLERCIGSILQQDFKDYEIILVDDGSSDESPQICDAYVEKYPNIRVIHKENGGLSSARNAGLEIAAGEYVWWIDSDDWIENEALSEVYRVICDNRPDIVKFNYNRVTSKQQPVLVMAEAGLHAGTEKIAKLLHKALYSTGAYSLSAWGHIYSRDFLNRLNIRFVSERKICSEDYLFNLSVLPHASAVYVLPALLYNYELRQGSLSTRYKKNLFEQYEELYRLLVETYQCTGILNQHQHGISFFYVWHLIRGTCMSEEYRIFQGHSLDDGRRKVKKILRSNEFQEALSHCDIRILPRKQQVMLMAMRLKLECFFHYLYVTKPKLRGKHGT